MQNFALIFDSFLKFGATNKLQFSCKYYMGKEKNWSPQPYNFIKRRKPGSISKTSTKVLYPISFRRKTFRVFIFAIFGRHETKIVINAFILLNFICQSSFYVKTTYKKNLSYSIRHLLESVLYLGAVLKSEDFVSRCTYM